MQFFIDKFSLLISGLPRSWLLLGYIFPMALACTGIAGLPMSMALVSVLCALFCCFIFGEQSEALMVLTPFSTLVLLASIASYTGALAEHAAMVSLLTLFTGLWLLVFTLVFPRKRMNWIARPVWHGICLGISLILIILMMPLILGVIPDNSTWSSFWKVLVQWQKWNFPSLILVLISLTLLLCWRSTHQPRVLWLVVIMCLLNSIWSFECLGVAIPVQPNWLFWPLQNVAYLDWFSIIFMSATIALLIYVEICQHLAYRVQHNFIMAGISNLMSAICGGMVVGLCLIHGRVYKIDRKVLLTMLLLMLVIYCLWWWISVPLPVFAVILLYVLYRQFRWCEFRLYKGQWFDLVLLCMTALVIVLLGVLLGLWLIMTLSLIFMWWCLMRERAWPLLQPELQIITDAIVITLPQKVLFANVRSLLHYVGNIAKDLPYKDVYIDVDSGCCIDVTVLVYLQSLARRMHWHGKNLYICGLDEMALNKLLKQQLDYLPADRLGTSKALQMLHLNMYNGNIIL